MKNKESSLTLLLAVLPVILKSFIGAIACFLILFGIHWIAILTGLCLGVTCYILTKK